MAKKITAFRDMCQEDQVALLKGGCTEMMIMRSVIIYDNDRGAWKVNAKFTNLTLINLMEIFFTGATYQRKYGEHSNRFAKVCQRKCLRRASEIYYHL